MSGQLGHLNLDLQPNPGDVGQLPLALSLVAGVRLARPHGRRSLLALPSHNVGTHYVPFFQKDAYPRGLPHNRLVWIVCDHTFITPTDKSSSEWVTTQQSSAAMSRYGFTSLAPFTVMGTLGFEPKTSCASSRRSTSELSALVF